MELKKKFYMGHQVSKKEEPHVPNAGISKLQLFLFFGRAEAGKGDREGNTRQARKTNETHSISIVD